MDFLVTEYLSSRHESCGIVSPWLTRSTPETQRWLNAPSYFKSFPPARKRETLR